MTIKQMHLKVVLPLSPVVAVGTKVVLFPCVGLLVDTHLRLGRKPFKTKAADVGLLSGVPAQVNLEVVLSDARKIAVRALGSLAIHETFQESRLCVAVDRNSRNASPRAHSTWRLEAFRRGGYPRVDLKPKQPRNSFSLVFRHSNISWGGSSTFRQLLKLMAVLWNLNHLHVLGGGVGRR